ncbi:MAG: hypothetical protein AABZ74_14715 [Cyanobacteriota bacterium]
MLAGKRIVYLTIGCFFSVFSLTSCGSGASSDFESASPNYQTVAQVQALNPSGTQNCCNCTCQNPSTASVETVVDPNVTVKKKKAKTTTTPATTTPKPATTTPAVVTPAPAVATVDDKGRKALDKVLAFISNTNAYEALVEKTEKSLIISKTTTQKLKVISKKPGQVKFDVLEHSNSSTVGAKLSYTRGTGKATIRPGGALKFITKEFPQTDSNITSPNEYRPDQVDFFALIERLSLPTYKAELTGKSNIDGKDVYLIKVTSSSNSLDSKITHEIIGFDPTTFQPVLWEAYAGEDLPYMKTTIKSFNALSDIPDSSFKV